MTNHHHRLPPSRARLGLGVEVLEERLLLSGPPDGTGLPSVVPGISSTTAPTSPPLVGSPPGAVPPVTVTLSVGIYPESPPLLLPPLVLTAVSSPSNVPTGPTFGNTSGTLGPVAPQPQALASPAIPLLVMSSDVTTLPTVPSLHVDVSGTPAQPPPLIAELVPLNGSALAVVVTLSRVAPTSYGATAPTLPPVGGRTPRVPQPISLASLQVANTAGGTLAPPDSGREGPSVLTMIDPGDRQGLPGSDNPSGIRRDASAFAAIPRGPSTKETSSREPVSSDWSTPRIDFDDPGKRHSWRASAEAVGLATLAVFTWFIIRVSTVASQDSSEDPSPDWCCLTTASGSTISG
jgi:hypothetical protein